MDSLFLHRLFRATILLKGISGVLELAAGVLFSLLSTATVTDVLVDLSSRGVISWSDIASDYLVRQADLFTVHTKHFVVFYFLFYGIINVLLMLLLWRGRLWAYPTAIALFGAFIVYQIVRAWLHSSGLLMFLALFDVFVVALAWLEYRRLIAAKAAA